MADSQCQGVSGIVGPWDLLHIEKPLGHQHHLALVRAPVARHRLLDLHGGILKYRHPQLFRRQEDHPTAMGHGDAGGNILTEEKLLHRHLVGMEGADQLLHVVGNLQQPAGQRDTRRRGDDPVLNEGVFPSLGLNDPKADRGHSGVDA